MGERWIANPEMPKPFPLKILRIERARQSLVNLV